jgi:hypothetical protein
MLASVIHCLTLVAFSAHVLLGCCAHHYHDVTPALCSQHQGHAHDAGHLHDDHDHESAESSCHELVSLLDTDHPVSPCNHSHDCERGDCTFVSSDSRVVASTTSDVFVLMSRHASSSADVRRFLDVVRSENLSTCCLLVGHRCALQQSWQI